ncbi:replication-associated recombination protein A [Egibacter rhizosphaerae]|uniref:Replication-associated recombination protein A n=1 Tax=Egibacter rhizosphaerae TaxID=1670831 RepID=A0A411YL48_9ACTN|nr:replication-associated recombination protein A [Egibacter rhizosphaerae]
MFDDEATQPPRAGASESGGPPSAEPAEDAPLAARLRPRSLDEVVGQAELLGPEGPLRRAIEADRLRSVVLWGPPGTGKTTLAHVVAATTDAAFTELSAVTAGVKDVRRTVEEARERRGSRGSGRRTVLFVDEIHRFNKAQQDALLPGVEDGSVTLIGATTENPTVEVNAPLLSRSLLYRLEPLGDEDLRALVERALDDPRGLPDTRLTDEGVDALLAVADGDARVVLTVLETAADLAAGEPVGPEAVRSALASPNLRYDKAGDAHYDQVSAFIKAMRGSDPDAAVYWLVRMLTAGEDPRFLARRMIILAGEDVGLADPRALEVATSAWDALNAVGLPEARYALAQAALYLALAPKSNSVTTSLRRADAAVERLGNAPVPAHLRDAHYSGASRLGHGEGYRYPHDDPRGWVEQRYLPDGLEPGAIYPPGEHGEEPEIGAWRPER